MNTTTTKKAKTLNREPLPIDSPGGFHHEALTIIKTAVAQRRRLIYSRKSKINTSAAMVEVFAQHDAWKNRWTLRGIARFVLNHEAGIRLVIPTSNKSLTQRLENIVNIAPRFANQN